MSFDLLIGTVNIQSKDLIIDKDLLPTIKCGNVIGTMFTPYS